MAETIRKRRGLFRNLVTIERRVETVEDNRGAVVPTWDAVATRWASIVPLGMRETFQAQQVESDVTHQVIFDYFADLTARHRLTWTDTQGVDRIAHIKAVIDIEERGIKQACQCVEVKS